MWSRVSLRPVRLNELTLQMYNTFGITKTFLEINKKKLTFALSEKKKLVFNLE